MKKKSYKYDEVFNASMEYFKNDDLATKVFVDKYALTDGNENYFELTPDDMHKRLAKEFARIEKKYPNPMDEKEIYELFKGFKKVIPQGSPMSGIGNNFQVQSLSNCFTLTPPFDSYGGILYTDQELVQIAKRRGGIGIDISNIRPIGLKTNNAAKTTDGINVFMERYSNSTREVAQKGRRGALILTISVHHPEIETFINIKRDRKRVTGANISIRLTDEFMNAVKENKKYELRWPVNSKEPTVSKLVDATYIWDEIIKAAHDNAEPGLLLWDNILKYTPADIYKEEGFESVSVNPCLTDDTWVMTDIGPRQIKELINKEFITINQGKKYKSSKFFKTGYKKVFKIKTKNGYSLKATLNHKIMTNRGWVETKKLKKGDKIVLQNHNDIKWEGNGTFEEGWLVGEIVGDGCFNPDKYLGIVSFWGNERKRLVQKASDYTSNLSYIFRSDFLGGITHNKKLDKSYVSSRALDKLSEKYITKKSKDLMESIEKSSYDFYIGFLRGFFDADGSVQGNLKKGVSVRLSQNNLKRLETVQRMLLRLGIKSKIYKNRNLSGYRFLPDGNGGLKKYFCKSMHELVISKDMIDIFYNKISFETNYKKEKLENIFENRKRKPYKTKFTTEFIGLEEIGYENVYDCTVEDIHSFDANGIQVHNCSELNLAANDACRLLLMNASTYVLNPFTNKAKFDFKSFANDAQKAQRLMDNLVDLELEQIDKILSKIEKDAEPEYIKKIEKDLWEDVKKKTSVGRRTGLGLTAIGDCIAMLNLKYGSNGSIKFVENLYKELCLNAYMSSCIMAKERGKFEIFNFEKEIGHPFIERIYKEKPELKSMAQKYGRRNIALLTTAPAGSVSCLTQTSSGIEPVFMLEYTRRKKIMDGSNVGVDFVDDLGDKWQHFKVYHHGIKKWMEVSGETDFSKSPYWGATANEINWENRVKLQASAQKFICHSISSTVNLPEDVSTDEVKKIYMTAWEAGCKGITIYREGSRTGVLVDSNKLNKSTIDAEKRPDALSCDIHHVRVNQEDWIVVVGMVGDSPYEIFGGHAKFVEIPKKYTTGEIIKHFRKTMNSRYDLRFGFNGDSITLKDIVKQFENPTFGSMTRMISLSLRHNVPINFIVEQLQKNDNEDLFSFAKVIARVLKKYIKDGTKASVKKCTNCNKENSLIYQEGCLRCVNCGYSKCG